VRNSSTAATRPSTEGSAATATIRYPILSAATPVTGPIAAAGTVRASGPIESRKLAAVDGEVNVSRSIEADSRARRTSAKTSGGAGTVR
jgi:hypothetical protein